MKARPHGAADISTCGSGIGLEIPARVAPEEIETLALHIGDIAVAGDSARFTRNSGLRYPCELSMMLLRLRMPGTSSG